MAGIVKTHSNEAQEVLMSHPRKYSVRDKVIGEVDLFREKHTLQMALTEGDCGDLKMAWLAYGLGNLQANE